MNQRDFTWFRIEHLASQLGGGMNQNKNQDTREDLREYSDAELSLRVFNDEGIYLQRRRSGFIDLLREIFIFSDEQLEELEQDLQADSEES